MDDQGDGTIANGPLSKVSRRRLKKLEKRTAHFDASQAFSGLVESADAEEYRQLKADAEQGSQTAPTVVTIDWKNYKQRTTGIDSASHRELLLSLCPPSTSQPAHAGDKRKRGGGKLNSCFGWASIHNKALVSQVVVVELQFSSTNSSSVNVLAEQIQASIMGKKTGDSSDASENSLCVATTSISVPTLWFQSNATHPASITDVLMYKQSSSSPGSSGEEPPSLLERDSPSTTWTARILAPCLALRTLTDQQQLDNRYAKLSDGSTAPDGNFCARRLTEPKDISLEEAETFVKAHLVPTQNYLANVANVDYVVSLSLDEAALSDLTPRVFGIDCEMVETDVGIELGRITVCELCSYSHRTSKKDTEGRLVTHTVMDVFVKPKNPVVDYKTAYSGLTEEILNQDSVVSLEQVQAFLLQLIHAQDIVVGHSLENDLHAIQWIHPTVVDTAILFQPQPHGRSKFSLKHLSRTLLRRAIQIPGQPHCSEQDATAALELAVRRVVEGPEFSIGKQGFSNNWFTKSTTDNRDPSVCAFGPASWLQKHILSTPNVVHAVECESVKDSKAAGYVKSRLTNQSSTIVWASLRANESSSDAVVNRITDWVGAMGSTAVMMVAIQANYDSANRAAQGRSARKTNSKATMPWTFEAEQDCSNFMDTARQGRVLWVSTKRPKSREPSKKQKPS